MKTPLQIARYTLAYSDFDAEPTEKVILAQTVISQAEALKEAEEIIKQAKKLYEGPNLLLSSREWLIKWGSK